MIAVDFRGKTPELGGRTEPFLHLFVESASTVWVKCLSRMAEAAVHLEEKFSVG